MAPAHKAFVHLENTVDDKVMWVPSAHPSTVTHVHSISPLLHHYSPLPLKIPPLSYQEFS